MKLQPLFLAAALSSLAGAALAAGPGQATLQNTLAKPITVIAGDGIWTCQGEACSTGSASDQSLTIDACRTLEKAVGPITAYAVDGSSLRPAPLARCNAVSASR